MDASLFRAFAFGSLCAGWLLVSASVRAAEPSAAQALRLRPIQKDVDFDLPTDEEVERCTVRAFSQGGVAGWHVHNAAGQLLRRFLDTNQDNRLDQWCYYKGGVEVYRDIDTDFNGKADQYRWLGTAGIRWGVDENENGRIDRWKSISAEEVTAEVVAALRDNDKPRFLRLLPTTQELQALGLGEVQATLLARKVAAAAQGFDELAGQQTVIGSNSRWLHFGASPPGILAAGFEGSARDLMVYDNVSAIVETDGATTQIAIGTLVQVEGGWRVIDLPNLLADGSPDTGGGFFFQQAAAVQPQMVSAQQGLSEAMQTLLRGLEEVDKGLAGASSAAELSKLHERRAVILETLANQAATAEEQETWIRQYADTISAAAQAGEFAGGVPRLASLAARLEQRDSGAELAAYVRFRWLAADYGNSVQQPNADFAKIQEKWLDDLLQFVTDYPRSEETPEAMLQLAVGEEFSGKTQEAIEWYGKIASGFADSPQAAKAAGAKRRLESVGNVISLAGTALDGKPVSLASLRDRTVLIHYWATWCEPCKQDLAVLKQMHAKYGRQGFALIGINLDSERDVAVRYLQSEPLPWPQLYEPGGLDGRFATEMGILTLPTMILIGKDGKVLNRNIYAGELDTELSRHVR
jgi:thiol-disulfide isomerase/thioredoxin